MHVDRKCTHIPRLPGTLSECPEITVRHAQRGVDATVQRCSHGCALTRSHALSCVLMDALRWIVRSRALMRSHALQIMPAGSQVRSNHQRSHCY